MGGWRVNRGEFNAYLLSTENTESTEKGFRIPMVCVFREQSTESSRCSDGIIHRLIIARSQAQRHTLHRHSNIAADNTGI
jgi:hypothetical protein